MFRVLNPSPQVFGTGLIAVDVVVNQAKGSVQVFVGGTCGNVLTILSYLNWQSFPIARLAKDSTWKHVSREFSRWKVGASFVNIKPTTATPIVIQNIRQDKEGRPIHRFSLNCPTCGAWLPRYAPVPAGIMSSLLRDIREPRVLFVDRISPGAVVLAKDVYNKGGLVVCEPTGKGDPKLFQQLMAFCQVLKYPEERRAQFVGAHREVLLEIETQGKSGLKYRFGRSGVGKPRPWKHSPAFPVSNFVDAAGAGDWCTAGIIHMVGQRGRKPFEKMKEKEVFQAIRFGQALAAWNCQYEGARGGMYMGPKKAFQAAITEILSGEILRQYSSQNAARSVEKLFGTFCIKCQSK